MDRKCRGYWTYENLKNAALEFNTIGDFRRVYGGAYYRITKLGIQEEMYAHMQIKGHLYSRFIYAAEFEDKSVYVGLTCDLDKRKQAHINDKNSSIYKYIESTKLLPEFKLITKESVSNEKAKNLEYRTLEDYKNQGWRILNKAKTGSLGGNYLKWNYNNLSILAGTYNTRSEFQDNDGGAYAAATRLGIIQEICSHMVKIKNPKFFWKTKEQVKKEASKYKNKKEFKNKSFTAYTIAIKNYWIEEFFPNSRKVKERGYWNQKFNFLNEASKHNTAADLKRANESCYNAGKRNNWINEFYG